MATPHTRGSTFRAHTNRITSKGYPAYAGIDPTGPGTTFLSFRLPRIRGDRPTSSHRSILRTGATPHTRGSTWIEEEYGEKRKGYPAYAGIDPQATISSEYTRRLPRIRGDRPAFKEDSAEYVEATPHTRGSTPIRAQIKQGGEGYPAYAGIDLHYRHSC